MLISGYFDTASLAGALFVVDAGCDGTLKRVLFRAAVDRFTDVNVAAALVATPAPVSA